MTAVQVAVIGYGPRPKRRGASLPAALHAFMRTQGIPVVTPAAAAIIFGA